MKRQVVVVGAGPGGCTAAFYLAKAGIDVLLIDKETWPRDKICGDSYLPALYPFFEDMGIMNEMKAAAACNPKALRIIDPDEEYADFDVEPWLIAPRRIGDDIIRRGALTSGADFMENFQAEELIIRRGVVRGIKGIYNNREIEVEADAVVIADGSHSALARQLGIYKEDPEYILYAGRAYYDGVEGMEEGKFEEFYTPSTLPKPTYSPICLTWVAPLYQGKYASVGITIAEKYLRETGMTLEGLFQWWCENTKFGRERMHNAKPVEKLKGWRLPGSRKIERNYAPGAVVIGDAVSSAEAAFEYGIPSSMIGGRVAASFLPEVLSSGDFSEKKFSEFQTLVGKELNPGLEYNANFRDNILANKKTMKQFQLWAKTQPGYPHLIYDQSVVKFITEVLHKEIVLSDKKITQ
jgi:flavin-dependent dehydrogenase